MFTVGQKVVHYAHGWGTVVALNGAKPISEHSLKLACDAGVAGLCISGFYSGDKYPYIVQFDSGYKDVYSDASLVTPEQFNKGVFESGHETVEDHYAGPMPLSDVISFLA